MMKMMRFKVYQPNINTISPELAPAVNIGGVFIRDSEGRDFYESQKLFSDNTLKVVFDDVSGNVIIVRESVSDVFPNGYSLIEVPHQEYDPSRPYTVDVGTLSLRVNTTLETSSKKQGLIDDADAVIQPMLGYAVAGVLSDAEKEAFKAWNEYRKALEDVDVTATNIEWPAKPE